MLQFPRHSDTGDQSARKHYECTQKEEIAAAKEKAEQKSRNRKPEKARDRRVKGEQVRREAEQQSPKSQILPTSTACWFVRLPTTPAAGDRSPLAAAAMSSERAELARLCSTRNWSKAIRLLDSILARSPSSIHDLWYGTLLPAPRDPPDLL